MKSMIRSAFRNVVVPALGLTFPTMLMAQASGSTPATALTGSVTSSYTYSDRGNDHVIVGRLYGRRLDEFMLNMAILTLDRAAPTDRAGAGFHVEGFAGQNAAVVKSAGLDLGPNADIWQAYAVLNLPLKGAGHSLQLKTGKMATLLGVEVGEDVLNPNLDVGSQDVLLEPFTETGAEIDAKLGSKADFEFRISNGWDQVTDLNSAKSITARLGLTPDSRTLIALAGYTGPEQADNNHSQRSGLNLVVTRKLSGSTWMAGQGDLGREEGIGPNGGNAAWSAVGVWLTQDLSPAATLAVRGDYLNDRDGVRTSGALGYPANSGMKLTSLTATLNIKSWDHALLRPEVRYDHSSLAVFGGHQQQLSLALGMSYLF
jgi:hypothetical protein